MRVDDRFPPKTFHMSDVVAADRVASSDGGVSIPLAGMNGSWFVSALAWNMGAFGRNPVVLVLWDETNDVLA
jgi:hypothetical protein